MGKQPSIMLNDVENRIKLYFENIGKQFSLSMYYQLSFIDMNIQKSYSRYMGYITWEVKIARNVAK